MDNKINYEFTSKPWKYSSSGGWYFVTLPIDISQEIRENLKWQEEGWGRLKAIAKIGNTEWQTAIWFDTKNNSYLLPLKSEIRKKENIQVDVTYEIIIYL